jgi:acetyl-CoA synthetase
VLEQFNWALDWFDEIGRGPRRDCPALFVVDDNGRETRLSFAQLSARSSQMANFLRSLGMKRGDRALVMVGNIPALWETTLAIMKLGGVVSPTTTLLTHDELKDRIVRGRIQFVIAGAEFAYKFGHVGPECVRVAIGSVPDWHSYSTAFYNRSILSPPAKPDRTIHVCVLYVRHDGKAQARDTQPRKLSWRSEGNPSG